MILVHKDNVDMRLSLEQRDDFLDFLKLRFVSLCPKFHLKIFGIPSKTLNDFKPSKGKHAFNCEPDEKFRLIEEEI